MIKICHISISFSRDLSVKGTLSWEEPLHCVLVPNLILDIACHITSQYIMLHHIIIYTEGSCRESTRLVLSNWKEIGVFLNAEIHHKGYQFFRMQWKWMLHVIDRLVWGWYEAGMRLLHVYIYTIVLRWWVKVKLLKNVSVFFIA